MRILTLFCLAQVLGAQAGVDPWSGLRSSNPPGMSIALRLTNPHAFRQGEVIRAELDLPDFFPGTGSPPAEQWQFTGLLLDPATNCGTVPKPCFLNETEFHLVNGPRGVSDRQTLALNSYLPALPAGRYRVAALARNLVLRTYTPGSNSYIYSDPPRYAVSDSVEVEVIGASATWVKSAIARSVATLNGPQPRDKAGYEEQREAAQQLAFLNDPAA